MRHFLSLTQALAASGVGSEPQWFEAQLNDHFSARSDTYKQRYYVNDTYFRGPGWPILCIMGGEGGIEPSTGIFYPWIEEVASELGALVVEPEHRFYGASRPNGSRVELLSPQQALADAAYFVEWIRSERANASSPAAAIGGSYPGFLAAAARLRYPDVFQAAYAASAPVTFYSQQVSDEFAYYAVVTRTADAARPGCSDAVRAGVAAMTTLEFDALIEGLGLCDVPAYISTDADLLRQEVNMVLQYTFAGLNMANYPPGPNTTLALACAQGIDAPTPLDGVRSILFDYAQTPGAACFNMTAQLPSGPDATVSSGDWSGVGVGDDGESWDFQTCTFLVETIGTNNRTDMFAPRNFTNAWLEAHCASRFAVAPQPYALNQLWGFDPATLPSVASNIYFTNGMNDGWSVGGITTNLSDSLIAFNIADGAHHSDLSHTPPSSDDTPSVVQARQLGLELLRTWLRAPRVAGRPS